VIATSPTVGKNVLPDGAEELSNLTMSDVEIPDGDDALSEVDSDGDDEDGAVSSSESESHTQKTSALQYELEELQQKPSDIQLMDETLKAVTINKYESEQAVSPSPNLTASIKVAEVVLNSLDPLVNGKLAETINKIPIPIGETIEQDMDASEAATENTPSPAPSAPSSSAETKSTANANPYLASLKSVWNPSSIGRHEITTLFSISGDVNPSNIIAQAYIHPSGKKLNFSADAKKSVGTASSYITVEAEVPKSNFFIGTGPITNSRTENRLSQFRQALLKTYLESFNKINAEYKQLNPGKELETLVIAPITSTDGILLEVESTALVTAIKEIQHSNPSLKIAISADKEAHSDAIRAAYEK
jgi:hypothetical protein